MKYTIATFLLTFGFCFSLFAQDEIFKPTIISNAVYFDVSLPLRDVTVIQPGLRDHGWKDGVVKNKLNMPEHRNLPLPEATEADFQNVQYRQGNRESELLVSVNGVGNENGVLPPDTQGDVGINHYMQMVNMSFAIWDKTGTMVYGPADNSTLWSGFPGPWSGSNDGDPVVLYDEAADRWVASQFALPNYPYGPFYELIAVSQTGDPTGSWYRYAFTFTNMPDYPKLGVWHDAYYLSVNSFTAGSLNWGGTGVAALERDKMLAGDPTASMVFFTTPASGNPSSFLPADCDGTPAPADSPGLFGYVRDGSPDKLEFYALDVDWTTPANSTFGLLVTLPTVPFSSNISGVAQNGTSTTLQAISDRLMYRLQYRNFGTYQTMVTNHTVNVSGHAGVRWYELRNTGSGWQIYQQGTYSPDATSRWMGSVAMNSFGDIALGYSASSASLFPSIRVTGRRAGDPLGEMTFAELDIVAGGGSQTSSYRRWGDYSMMSVDPSNNSIFWYTQEYYTSTSNQGWKTRVGSFTFGIPLIAEASASPDTICAGESTQLSVDVTGGAFNLQYEWSSSPEGFTANVSNPLVSPEVTTTYTITVTNNGNTATSSVTVVVNPSPSVNAFDDLAVCAGNSVSLAAEAAGHSTVLWTSRGDGTFTDASLLATEYLPGNIDLETGSVVLVINVQSGVDCGNASDSLVLVINKAPTVNAGLSVVSCNGAPVQLSGVATDFSSIAWISTGDGSFSDPGIANPLYTPGNADILAGSVDLFFTAYGNTSCPNVADTTDISIVPAVILSAGADLAACAGESITLDAIAQNFSAIQWQTSGDGQFADPLVPGAIYEPGALEIINGQALLDVTAYGLGGCPDVTDQLAVTINPLPVVAAGNDTTICKTSGILVSGNALNAGSWLWTSSGNGTFENAQELATWYLPGTQDTIQGAVTLSLTATSPFGCNDETALKTVQFSQCLGVESQNQPSVKILPNPTNGKFSVEISGIPLNLSCKLFVTDSKGELVIEKQFSSSEQLFKTMLDLTNRPKGIYMLKLSAASVSTTVKIILQ
ncbi:MAG: T9SS type A sorting domain-containing protein [Lentimicrobium sp.]|nr:T9SS type A sorting domain-containing protein [Lentimicrobium sp.]